MPRTKKALLKLAIHHPLAKASEQCIGLIGLLSNIESLPSLPYPDNTPFRRWQWHQFNPDWREFVETSGVAEGIAKTAIANTRATLSDALKMLVGKDSRSRDATAEEPSNEWVVRTASVVAQLHANLRSAPFEPSEKVDLYLVCRIGRDRLALDGFASLVRSLNNIHTELILFRGSSSRNPFTDGLQMSLPMQKKQIAAILGISVKTLNSLVKNRAYKIEKHSHKTYRVDLSNIPAALHSKLLAL